jgi:hypothetical protein
MESSGIDGDAHETAAINAAWVNMLTEEEEEELTFLLDFFDFISGFIVSDSIVACNCIK